MRLQEQPETKAEFLKRSILDYGLGLKAFTFTIRKNNHIECIRKKLEKYRKWQIKIALKWTVKFGEKGNFPYH